jgi:hypothetical protein
MVVKTGVVWTKVKDMALEDEMTLAVKNFVNKKFKSLAKNFFQIMYNKVGKPIMEWNGIFLYHNKVFLCESKHKITNISIKKLI